jgi:DICT domain-containing protein
MLGAGVGAGLTIGAVAAQTTVGVATLRAWERRYGFPTPDRLPGGHRRYTDRHVDQIREVLRDRETGMSLEAAIARVRESAHASERSILAGLRRRRPDLPVHVLSKRAMLAISRAIEDECCARADEPVLVGSFQQERFYRQSEPRWRELARTASAVIVIAHFEQTRVRRRLPTEVALTRDAPLRREWAIVCDAPDASACLAGVELLPARASRRQRRFEAVWSVEPAVVRHAVEVAVDIVRNEHPSLEALARDVRTRALVEPLATPIRMTALTNRVIAYLDTTRAQNWPS